MVFCIIWFLLVLQMEKLWCFLPGFTGGIFESPTLLSHLLYEDSKWVSVLSCVLPIHPCFKPTGACLESYRVVRQFCCSLCACCVLGSLGQLRVLWHEALLAAEVTAAGTHLQSSLAYPLFSCWCGSKMLLPRTIIINYK